MTFGSQTTFGRNKISRENKLHERDSWTAYRIQSFFESPPTQPDSEAKTYLSPSKKQRTSTSEYE